MKTSRTPLAWLALTWAVFASYVLLTAPRLPERLATHFSAAGEPNDWMTRAGHVEFTLLAGLLVPGFVLGLFAIIGRSNGGWLNIPHKEHWLSPERREATFDFVRRQGYWFAALFVAFLAGMHHSILAANARSPVCLPSVEIAWIAGGFIAAAALWAGVFIRHFYRRPA